MSERQGKRASIVVDLWRVRCDHCKVALRDDLAATCAVCGSEFDSIVSNHVGLATKLHNKRKGAGVHSAIVR